MFYADLHIHSRFSRATSSDCTLDALSMWAHRKGIAVLGTGDFTHPGWMAEIREKLVPAEPGLFRLRPDLEKMVAQRLPPSLTAPDAAERLKPGLVLGPTRFLLQVEISTIYKRNQRTRKVHHLLFAPDLAAAERIFQRLARIGNLTSDGRPILGLDSRNLLEITLEAGEGSFLIPAHIWTPWFSALGSQSGFDSIEECYADLAPHVFALETGLSSDPPMNWRLSILDRYRLVSNSDAHSPAKLGREACVFDTPVDYFALRNALATGFGYEGTVEFFPEEGKYHMDGHRKCNVCLAPPETRKNHGLCPVCGKPLTVGVMHRVEALADRPEGIRPSGAASFRSFIPLPEVLGNIFDVGPASRKVATAYDVLLNKLGPELPLLEFAALDSIRHAGSSVLAEAVDRMRHGRVIREAGYDGEYGVIRLFDEAELKTRDQATVLFDVPAADPPGKPGKASGKRRKNKAPLPERTGPPSAPPLDPPSSPLDPPSPLDPDQQAAASVVRGPLLIIAGPGTGKTRTLTHRIARLISEHGVPPAQCLAITFTNRAAREMAGRLAALLPPASARVTVTTFHAFGYRFLREHFSRLSLPLGFRVAADADRLDVLSSALGVSGRKAESLVESISRHRRGLPPEARRDETLQEAAGAYLQALHKGGWVDFDDLILLPLGLLESDAQLRTLYRQRYSWIAVDEFQDIDPQQYRLIRHLVPPDGNLCAIGDPDQSIYAFRGTDVRCFQQFTADFPSAQVVRLTRNYRSSRSIVAASLQVIAPATLVEDRVLTALADRDVQIEIHASLTDRAEAEFVVHSIEKMIGGSTFFSMDSGRVDDANSRHAFGDFAVLYRTAAQSDALGEAFTRSGMPFQIRTHLELATTPVVRKLFALMERTFPGMPLAAGLQAAVEALQDEGERREAHGHLPTLAAMAAQSSSLSDFHALLAMGMDADLWDPNAERVSLLTLHASKGLEFPVVFIVGCEDGILPLRWGTDPGDDAEERRLLFVGMTRARESLILSHARRRHWRGQVHDMQPSPFLRDIEAALLDRTQSEHRRRHRPNGEQLALF